MRRQPYSAAGIVENRRLRHAFEHSPDAIVLVDPREDQILDANPRACSLLGYTHSELIHTHVSEIHPDDMPRLVSFADSVAEYGHGWSDELSCRTKSGTIVPAEVSASAIDSDDGALLIAVVRSLLERQRDDAPFRTAYTQIKQRLAALTRRQALILNAMNQGVLILDPNGQIVFANADVARILCQPQAALIGSDLRHLLAQRAPRYALALGHAPVNAVIDPGQPMPLSDVAIRVADGSETFVRIACSPVREQGETVGSVIVVRDAAGGRKIPIHSPLPVQMHAAMPAARSANFNGLVGHSTLLRRIVQRIVQVAPTAATVLITGESGTGKELVARAIHDNSPRGKRPFIKVNCSAVPRELFESEFFGHVRGAFTGAHSDRRGRFELAHGGTLFLDEIGELPLEMQSKLLGVLQEGRFERVGEARMREVDVRVIAATNRNLAAAIDAGVFRRDLYYRLNIFPIHIPPLRERRDDIPMLAQHLLATAEQRLGRNGFVISAEQIACLMAHDWPGNVRELQNAIERAVIAANAPPQLEFDFSERSSAQLPETAQIDQVMVLTEAQRRERDRCSILAALRSTRGRVGGPGGAAELLGLKPTTLRSRIKVLGLQIETVVSAASKEPSRVVVSTRPEANAAFLPNHARPCAKAKRGRRIDKVAS